MAASAIPEHLLPYTVEQRPELYTPIDHACWRFILKISRAYLGRHAHPKYINGLQETGISPERIPLIAEMDARLQRFGWRAVAVSGFIPPAVFMEFLSLGILPIACDMRKLEHIGYTPAPDIVHEAAGHAPIIADPEYAAYLRSYGEISQKAIYSSQDMAVYHAVRHLSVVKEDPRSSVTAATEAQERLDQAVAAVDYVSEATELARMSWWTIEYGLIEGPGGTGDYQLYGAGLLSSPSESFHCLDPQVRKVPFSLDCIETGYDITKPQPQLYVAPSFAALTESLARLSDRMAFRRGGWDSLERALRAATVTTTVLESGAQISGIVDRVRKDAAGAPAYVHYRGPCQLAWRDEELANQGATDHAQGFGTPIGLARVPGTAPRSLGEMGLAEAAAAWRLRPGERARIEFVSGIRVEGRWIEGLERAGKLLLLRWDDCTVTDATGTRLFEPAWGAYDLACGARIVSVFGGPADRRRYLDATGGLQQDPGQPKTNSTPETRPLEALYARVRELREKGMAGDETVMELAAIRERAAREFPDDWLLTYEMLELAQARGLAPAWEDPARAQLAARAKDPGDIGELIGRGLALL